jgi:hypothetical protein
MSDPVGRAASALNREMTGLLADTGHRLGLGVVLEYPVRGGRLDVVWTWSPATHFPGVDRPVPVVGFEIESSWRTRKHVKGDLLNLQDAGVGLGVIVLAGSEARDDGLRRFAETLVDRPGPTVLIWTADDVRALAGEHESFESELAAATSALTVAGPAHDSTPIRVGHNGKYAPLYRWLLNQQAESLDVTFGEIEEVLGFPLPNSSREHAPHWHSYNGSAVARAIIDAGWKASRVHLADESLSLVRQRRIKGRG